MPPTGSLAATERAGLLALLARSGPDAPTLCEGWTTHDLAAHLVVRERQPLALPGLVLPPLSGVTERFRRAARDRPYEDLLADLRQGPPLLSPGSRLLPDRVRDAGDLHEWYVHHEDVRRPAAPGPRPAGSALQDALWARLATFGPLLAARARGLGLVLRRPDGTQRRVRRGGEQVVLRGEPAELFLWLFGRRAAAQVELVGTERAVARARAARFAV